MQLPGWITSFALACCLHGLAETEPQLLGPLEYHAAPQKLPAGAVVAEWPRFLGPNNDATSQETKLLATWPEEGLKVVWELACGDGYACPVIAGGRLVYFHRLDGKEIVECLDPETGGRFWEFSHAVEYKDRYGFSPGPRASAVIDDGRVYTAGVTAQLHCLDLMTGKLLWKRDLMKDFGVPQYFFGYGTTPVVWNDRLVVNVGGRGKNGEPGVCVAAFDKTSGKTLWEVQDAWGASYASPVVGTIRGKDCALVLAAGESKPSHGGLLTIDVRTGKLYDRFSWRARKYESVIASSPLVIDAKRVFISECYEKGGVMLEFDPKLKSKAVWQQREFGMHWMMPLVIGEHLYGFAGRNVPDVEFKCASLATGELAWTDEMRWQKDGRVEGLFRGSLLRAGGRVFALGEDGALAELELSPRGVRVKQRTRLFTAREAWTLPALHRGLLYVRQNSRDAGSGKGPRVICYDLRGR
jgi:outer membrane protein assembly factor BamB